MTASEPNFMLALLALADAVVSDLGDEKFVSRVHARAAEIRQSNSMAMTSPARAESIVLAIAELTSRTPDDAYQLVAERAVPLMVEGLGPHLRLHSTAHTFCLSLNTIVHSDLQALVPGVELPVIDVELLDLSSLRVSFVGTENAMAVARGLLSGVARHYGQVAQFSSVASALTSPVAVLAGRLYVDVRFSAAARSGILPETPVISDRRKPPSTVAPKGLFR